MMKTSYLYRGAPPGSPQHHRRIKRFLFLFLLGLLIPLGSAYAEETTINNEEEVEIDVPEKVGTGSTATLQESIESTVDSLKSEEEFISREERLTASWTLHQEQQQKMIDAIKQRIEDLDMQHQPANQKSILRDLKKRLRNTKKLLSTYEKQQAAEPVIPHIIIETERFTPYVTLYYQDMPEGYFAAIDGHQKVEIPTGKGSIEVPVTEGGGLRSEPIYLYDKEGVKVYHLSDVGISGSRLSRIPWGQADEYIRVLAHVPEVAETHRISTQEADETRRLLSETKLAIDQTSSAVQKYKKLRKELVRELNELLRGQIPYSRMIVNPENSYNPDGSRKHAIVIRYMSNLPHIFFEVRRGPNSESRHIEHAAGTADSTVQFGMGGMLSSGSEGHPIIVSMYSHSNRKVLLDEIELGYNKYDNEVTGGSTTEWGSIEIGRTEESHIEPKIAVANISGPMVMAAFQSPYNGTELRLDGGGFFAHASAEHVGGTELSVRNFVINGDAPKGTYRLHMYEPINMHEIAHTDLYWDGSSLSATKGQERIHVLSRAAYSAELDKHARQLEMQQDIQSLDVEFGSLRRAQRERLFSWSTFAMTPEEKNQCFDGSSLSDLHPDKGSIFQQGLTAWQDIVGEMLEEASNIAIDAWNGKSQKEAEKSMRDRYDEISRVRYVVEFEGEFGCPFPSFEEIRDEGIRLARKHVEDLQDIQAKNISLRNRDNYIASLNVDNSPIVRSQAAIERHLQTLAKAYHGDAQGYEHAIDTYLDSVDASTVKYVSSSDAEKQDPVLVAGLQKNSFYESLFVDESTLLQGETSVTTRLTPSGGSYMSFILKEPSMVNLWVDNPYTKASGIPLHLKLTLNGSTLEKPIISDLPENSGEAISVKVPAGTYTATVLDITKDSLLPSVRVLGYTSIPVGMHIEPYKSQEIIGRVATAGSSKTVGVRLHSDHPIKHNQDTWILVHGREDNSESEKMLYLKNALIESGKQVISLDWHEGASDNFPSTFGLQGENWIKSTAKVFTNLLEYIDVTGNNMYLAGHSWGSFISYEIASNYQNNNNGVQSIVALDPAKDPTISLRYDSTTVDFASVSKNSWSFHSSFWGSSVKSLTACRPIKVHTPEISSYTKKHSIAVYAFAGLVTLLNNDADNPIGHQFNIQELSEKSDNCMDSYAGWLWLEVYESEENDLLHAIPSKYTSSNPDDGNHDTYYFNNLTNLQHYFQ